MPLLARTLTAPLLVEIGPGTVKGLPSLLRDRRISPGGDVAFLLGRGQGEVVAQQLDVEPGAPAVFRVESASVAHAEQLATEVRARSYDAIVGIGGGRTLDVAKWVGTRLGIPTVSVATSLAHDGITSPVAVLEHGDRRGSYGVHTPLAVVVDTDFVRRADARITRAGIGDVLSNLSAVADWDLAVRVRGEPRDGLAAAMARTAATAVLDGPADLESEAFLTTLAEALVLSGLAMVVAGSSRPCSGACHEISHALDELYPGPAAHGEQVAVGALFATFLRGDLEGFDQLGRALSRFGLPLLPAGLGYDLEAFTAAVVAAPATRPERFTILEAEALGPEAARGRVEAFVAEVEARWPQP